MSANTYFSSVISPAQHQRELATSGARSLASCVGQSGSSWGREHLIACRVLVSATQHHVLPVPGPGNQPGTFRQIAKFIDGPTAPDFYLQSEHQLLRSAGNDWSLGQIWAALAAVLQRQEQQETGDGRPERVRQQTQREGYVRWPDAGPLDGSSPPNSGGSSQGSQASSAGYVEEQFGTTGTEDETVHLASSVIRHVLAFAPPQHGVHLDRVVEFRVRKTRVVGNTAGGLQVRAVDDGGLCLRTRGVNGSFVVADDHVAILEAKRQFQHIEDGQPQVTDNLLAQMVCEAIAARLATRKEDEDEESQDNRYGLNPIKGSDHSN